MIPWMLYTIALSLLITAATHACSQICSLFRIPTRWCWVAAFVCSIAAPIVARSVPVGVQGNALRVTAATYRVIQTVSEASPLPAAATTSSVVAATQNSITVAWAIASGVFLLALAVASTRLRMARRSWSSEIVCGERVLVSADTGPAVVGFFSHQIVLPAWVLELDDAEIALAVTHEREHVLAHDPRLLLAALLVVALAPWNPALWFQLRGLRRAVEGDCDARVLARTRDARRYATLLIAVGHRRNVARVPVLALSYPTSILEWRIRTMTDRTPSHRSARVGAYTALIGVLAATIVLLPRPGMSQDFVITSVPVARAGADTGTKTVGDSALRASLAATRDSLTTLRMLMKTHGTFTSGMAKAQATVSVATMQAAIAKWFPGGETAAPTPGSKRAFAFIATRDGSIEHASMDTTMAGAIHGFNDPRYANNKFSAAFIQLAKNIPVGRDTADVIWLVP
ncbi:MAG: M56 family metallopeptidase [Gemmatimonadaceae bacterium]